jgi:hypothetical protein
VLALLQYSCRRRTCAQAIALLVLFVCTAEPPDANLPEGWAMAKDPSGKPYYWHKATQKTQWDKPMA